MQQRSRRIKINGKRRKVYIKEKTSPRSTMVFIKHCIKDIQNKIKRITSNYSLIVSMKMPVFKNKPVSKFQSEEISSNLEGEKSKWRDLINPLRS